MESIDEVRLEEDAHYRFHFVARFIDFDERDLRALDEVAPALVANLDPLLEAIYERLREFDATWRHFAAVPAGCPMAAAARRRRIEELTPDHGMMHFRRHKLLKYFRYILLRPFDHMTIRHLDQMARRHRGKHEAAPFRIPLVQMNAFMAFVSDRVAGVLLGLGLDRDLEVAALRAIQKLLWLQTDLIARHYQDAEAAVDLAVEA